MNTTDTALAGLFGILRDRYPSGPMLCVPEDGRIELVLWGLTVAVMEMDAGIYYELCGVEGMPRMYATTQAELLEWIDTAVKAAL